MRSPHPWLAPVWQRLVATRARPAQALLFAGPAGVGKRDLARAWAQSLLCETPTPDHAACGQCAACHWFDAGTHPDFRRVSLLEKDDKKSGEARTATHIDVEQAREISEFIQLSTHRAGHRVVLVDPADQMNLAAANALLKAVEEPPPATVFLLVADHARKLLPTLRSRCQRIDFGIPPRAESERWLVAAGCADATTRLALAGGAPLAALAVDPAASAAREAVLRVLAAPDRIAPVLQAEAWKDVGGEVWHALAYTWLADLLAARLGARARFHPDFADRLRPLGARAAVPALLKLAREHADAGRYLSHPLNRNLQRAAWLVQYQNVFNTPFPHPRSPA